MRRSAYLRRSVLALALLACATVPVTQATERPQWNALDDLSTVQVVTVDPDGEERVTTVWLVVLDGQGYIRTADSRWFANLRRDPSLRLRARGTEYALRSELIDDDAVAARVDAAFRSKYGWSDRAISWIRNPSNRMRLVPR